jgi:hypothetical protein
MAKNSLSSLEGRPELLVGSSSTNSSSFKTLNILLVSIMRGLLSGRCIFLCLLPCIFAGDQGLSVSMILLDDNILPLLTSTVGLLIESCGSPLVSMSVGKSVFGARSLSGFVEEIIGKCVVFVPSETCPLHGRPNKGDSAQDTWLKRHV